MTALLLALAFTAPAGYPELLADVLTRSADGAHAQALELLPALEAEAPERYASDEMAYLEAELARRAGLADRAVTAYARVLAAHSPLADHAAMKFAQLAAARGDGEAELRALEVVAGFVPESIFRREALLTTVERLAALGELERARAAAKRLPRADRRAGDALLLPLIARSEPAEARRQALALVAPGYDDDAALAAAQVLEGTDLAVATRARLASIFMAHRLFGQAAREHLALAAEAAPGAARAKEHYWRARALYRLGQLEPAREAFALAALEDARGGFGLRARYQLGRLALEAGKPEAALSELSELAELDAGGVGDDAALKLLAVYQLLGDYEAAKKVAAARQGSAGFGARVGVVMAGFALERGEPKAALGWLDGTRKRSRELAEEVAYWRGVALEGCGQARNAAESYREAARGDVLFWRLAAEERLSAIAAEADSGAADATLERARQAIARGRFQEAARELDELLLRLPSGSRAVAARSLLSAIACELVSRDRAQLAARATKPDARELKAEKLALFGDAGGAARELEISGIARRGGLATNVRLSLLALAGGEPQVAVRAAERASSELSKVLPARWRAEVLAELLYPAAYPGLVAKEAARQGVDPHLIHAIMREESRFDPKAASAVGARGLMQFIPETAERIGNKFEILDAASSLCIPDVSVALGAAYLRELSERFQGFEPAMIAAYNAGEQAAELWLANAPSRSPEAFVRVVEWSETKSYVMKVLSSRALYAARERNGVAAQETTRSDAGQSQPDCL